MVDDAKTAIRFVLDTKVSGTCLQIAYSRLSKYKLLVIAIKLASSAHKQALYQFRKRCRNHVNRLNT